MATTDLAVRPPLSVFFRRSRSVGDAGPLQAGRGGGQEGARDAEGLGLGLAFAGGDAVETDGLGEAADAEGTLGSPPADVMTTITTATTRTAAARIKAPKRRRRSCRFRCAFER